MRRALAIAAVALSCAAAAVTIGASLGAAPAWADDGAPATLRWKATRGTVAAGKLAGSYVLASDAAPGRYSQGELVSVDEVALPYRFTVTWRRVGPEAGRSMHVLVAGGIVLIKQGAINFYPYDDAAFAEQPWQPIAGHRAQDEHTLVVTQDAREVIVTIDGVPAARYPLAIARTQAHVGVGMKSAPGWRSKLYLRALAIEPLQ